MLGLTGPLAVEGQAGTLIDLLQRWQRTSSMDAEGDDGLDDRGEEVRLSDLTGSVELVLALRCLASGVAILWATLVWS